MSPEKYTLDYYLKIDKEKKKKARLYAKQYYKENKTSIGYQFRLKKYGVETDDYDNLVKNQENRCAICKELPTIRKLAIDHDHIRGKIRGLLCHKCNVGLGLFEDNIAILKSAINYLNINIDKNI